MDDKELRELIGKVRDRPGLYGLDGTYYPTVTFLMGLDMGRSGRLLDGFTEWLLRRKGEESSLGWQALTLEEAFPDAGIRHWGALTKDQQQLAVDRLFSLLLDFLDERDSA
ncbi:hypothetical protein AB0O64_30975 [Streptomyces sp. NPDC088341]|uniref:hypothetical protein n=1 Tax=Streptomyces sp. NPDC088341 TaxID=3154870 RepID=UPI0034431B93